MKIKVDNFIEKEGLKLHYTVTGEGKPMILLNPAFLDMRIWNPLVDELATHYQVVQLDFRFTGLTDQDDSDYYMYEDLNILVKELGFEKVNLLGLSAGGHTALEFAIQYPDKVDKLFLISTGLFGVLEDERKVCRMEKFQNALYSGDVKMASKIWTKMWLVGEDRNFEKISKENVDLFMSVTQHNLMQSATFKMPRFMDPPVNEQLQKIENEVYHMVGTLDYKDVFESSKVFSEKIKNYHEERVEAAHIPPLEMPEYLIKKIKSIIK
jgi:pimeloyl-ACP methyl ester carboxylesterase